MPRLTSLSGAQVAVLFDDPLGIVEFDEVADGIPQLRDVAVDATMDDLFLQRAIEPLGDAVGLGLGDEGVGRLDAPELDLVGEVVRQILGAVIHPQGQPPSRAGRGRAIQPGKPHGDRLQGGEAVAARADMQPTHSAFQCSTAVKIQPQPSSTVNTRTPSVPHMRFGA